MEAARLPFSQVRVVADRLYVDGLVVDDETVVRLAAEARDPAKLVEDAIEIGGRILDREHTGANTEFVKAEFERAARDLDKEFVERARLVAERLDAKVDEIFGGEGGQVTQLLARHFGDESNVAVQNRVKALLAEAKVEIREDLRKQFSSEDGNNPLAAFQAAIVRQMREHSEHLRTMNERIVELRAEKEKLEELATERERGAGKGRSYEEAVFDAIADIARGRGDDAEAVGDTRGEGGRKGDVVVGIDACSGQSRGQIVFEAKDRRLSRNEALAELDACLATRSASYAVLVVPSEDELPARTHANTEFNANKVFCVFDPEEGSLLSLEVAYTLARARVLMARDDADGLDAVALRTEVERAVQALEEVRKIKVQLTNASTGIENARGLVDTMADTVRTHLAQVNVLLDAAEPEAA